LIDKGNAESHPGSTILDLDHPRDPMEDAPSSTTEKAANSSTYKPSVTTTGGGSGVILQIPTDALHNIASSLSPAEGKAISSTSRTSRAACQNVYTRVRSHGICCAMEAATAWTIGQKGRCQGAYGTLSEGGCTYLSSLQWTCM